MDLAHIPPEQRARLAKALLRNDFLTFAVRVFKELNPTRPFIHNWHHDAMAYCIGLTALTGENDRLIINLPPRGSKSTLVSVALVAFVLGRDPTRRIICVSYNQELANRFGRQTRLLMNSGWYRELFPSTAIFGRGRDDLFHTTKGGFRLATSTGGTLTGFGGDLILIDDPLKAEDAYSENARNKLIDWTTHTLFSRPDDKRKAAFILVQQRQHEDDLSGDLLRTGGWYHLNLPAIADKDEAICLGRDPVRFHHRAMGDVLEPAREPIDVLLRLKREMGTTVFTAQYLQSPLPPDGDMLKLSWFRTYDALPDRPDEVVLSIDTAAKAGPKNDWSVIQVWWLSQERFYLVSTWRRRVEYPTLKATVMSMADDLNPDTILIEDKGPGMGLIQDLRAEDRGYPVIAYDPGTMDKASRMMVQSAKVENGRVLLPPEAPWLEEFQNEVRRFPNGAHDDQMDAMSQLLDWKVNRGPGRLVVANYRR